MKSSILIITPGFAQDESDTSCIPFLQDYILTLAERIGKDKVKVITLQYPFYKKHYTWNGISVYSCRGKNRKGVYKLLVFLRCFLAARKWLKREKFILHTFWLTDATLIGKFIARLHRLRHIVTLMGQDVKKENKYLRLISLRNIEVVAFNDKMIQNLQASTGYTVTHKIPLGIRQKPFLAYSARTIDLLLAGSMIPLKQPFLFLDIVKKLQQSIPHLKAVMIGDGVLLPELKKQAADLPITFTGMLPREEVISYMHKAKLLVHTSEYEGQATVFSEALMQGMHAVCFDVGRPEHASKIHVYANEKEMTNGIFSLLNGALDFSPEASYSIQQVVDSYLNIYQDL